MARRGRPKSTKAASAQIVQIKLRLYPDEDDDLIAFFGDIPHRLRASMVKKALRSGIEDRAMPDDDATDALFDALDDLMF